MRGRSRVAFLDRPDDNVKTLAQISGICQGSGSRIGCLRLSGGYHTKGSQMKGLMRRVLNELFCVVDFGHIQARIFCMRVLCNVHKYCSIGI